MSPKRGQIFAAILVFIVLFFCGVVVVLYGVQQENIDSSLVSSRVVFEMRDNLEIFEMKEKALIEFLVDNVNGDFGSEGYAAEFRTRFIDEVFGNLDMMEFIYEDLIFNGRSYDVEAKTSGRDFLDVNLYGDFVNKDGKLFFSRNAMGKRFVLEANEDRKKIRFPVVFEFDFGQKDYVVTEGGVV
jgi:hypothetical protein